MTKKPTSIADAIARKTALPAAPAQAPAAAEQPAAQAMRMLSFRAPEIVVDQLREMAFVSRRSQQALVFEALNLLFTKHGKPPIAPDA